MGITRVSRGMVLAAGLLAAGCASEIPKDALQLSPEALSDRQMQTRRFDTENERQLLRASAQVLQDLGFQLDESESRLGVIVASKDRDAVETGQVVGSIIMAALFGASVPWDKKQKIRASLVTRPAKTPKSTTLVRISFQRIVWNTQNRVSKRETINDARIYQEFFSKLSKAVFLEANKI